MFIILFHAMVAIWQIQACDYIPPKPEEVMVAMTEYPSASRSKRELPWDWIRIKAEYDDSINMLNESMKDKLKGLVEDVLHYFETTLKVHRVEALQFPSTCKGMAQHFHDETICLGQCMKRCGPTNVSKSVDYFSCCRCVIRIGECDIGKCGGWLVDTDFVLFVSFIRDCRNTQLAYAAHCMSDIVTNRPAAGFMNICPEVFLRTKANKLERWKSIIKHELIHALVFSQSLFRNFPGVGKRKPQWNGSVVPIPNVVRRVTRLDWETSRGPVKHDVHMIVTPKVTEEARRHFNCSTLEGAELENQGVSLAPGNHWEKRVFENELLSSTATQVFALSRLTLALFEDSGWYRVNYVQAEDMEWGKNLGCAFVKKSCLEWMKMNPIDPYPFCTVYEDARCTTTRLEKLKCTLEKTRNGTFPPGFSPEYDYNVGNLYRDNEGRSINGCGSVTAADFCPYYMNFDYGGRADAGDRCTHPTIMRYDSNTSEVYSETSRCFYLNKTWKAGSEVLNSTRTVGCFESICKNNLLMIRTRGSKLYPCYEDGQLIHIEKDTYGGEKLELQIVCPSCSELCGPIFCSPDDEFVKERFSGPTRTAINRRARFFPVILLIVSLNNC
nr:Peptidase M8 domain containing protein [Haemonchus contortus]